jgi:hypothetical protein
MRRRAAAVTVAGLLAAAGPTATADEPREQKPWKVTASVLAYFVPDQPDFVMALVPVDVGRLHFEGRYNYEAVRSGSAFVGANAAWGDALKLTITPMLGAVLGDVRGLVPALRWTLTWWKVDLYSESEVVIDLGDAGASFFYQWAELGLSPLGWLRVGLAVQRSRVFQTALDVQRGLFVGVTIRFLTVTLYEFNAGWTSPTWVGAASVTF